MSPFEKPYPPDPITYSHYDALVDALEARFGSGASGFMVVGYDEPVGRRCSVAGEVEIVEGDRSDYDRLSRFHYRGGVQRFVQRVYRMTRRGELVGVIVYQYPLVRTQGEEGGRGLLAWGG